MGTTEAVAAIPASVAVPVKKFLRFKLSLDLFLLIKDLQFDYYYQILKRFNNKKKNYNFWLKFIIEFYYLFKFINY